MAQSHLPLDGPGRDTPVQAVEALEPGAVVVMTVRARSGADPLAGELDLVRGVVDEEPRVRRLAQPELERDRGCDQRRGAGEGRRDQHPRAPAANGQRCEREHDDAAAGQHRDRSQQTDIPALVRHPHEEREQAVWPHGTGLEAPRVGAQRADVEEDDGRERGEDDPRALARDVPRVGHGVGVRRPANAARSPFRER